MVGLLPLGSLAIFSLTAGGYVQTDASQFFPDVSVPSLYLEVMGAIANGASPPTLASTQNDWERVESPDT